MPRILAASSSDRTILPACAMVCAKPISMRTRRASTLFRDDYNFGRTDRFSFAFLMLPARSFWKRAGPRRRAPENVELAVADQPVLRVGNDNLSFGQGHRAEISELWRIADRVRLEHIAMLCTREAVDMVVP